jgi:thiamine transporter ThiT
MLFLRLVFGLLLISGLLCFAAYAFTGQPAWRQRGLKIIKWTLIAAVVLAAGILLERMLSRA